MAKEHTFNGDSVCCPVTGQTHKPDVHLSGKICPGCGETIREAIALSEDALKEMQTRESAARRAIQEHCFAG